MKVSGEVTCYYCGFVSGELIGDPEEPSQESTFRPIRPGIEPVYKGSRLRCSRCGGPVYLDNVEVVVPTVAQIPEEPVRRGRPPKHRVRE